ncbi:MAG: methionine ABC transporter ATP-binding protein [Tissierellia bacterium]|nr:methionine ABC transporter ATP-binding protein [Tissierellia bacterium]
MIKVENLVKTYNVSDKEFRALDEVSFEVNRGEIFGIIGLSGAGKSTLVRCINRLEEPDDGKILIEGKNILSMNAKEISTQRKKMSMIFQSFNLFNQKTVFKNIAYPLEIDGVSKNEIEDRVNKLLKFIDLESKKDEYPSRLSGGQKQRVAIARALVGNPQILLSDESTSALDPANTKVILDILKKAVKEFNLTIIMITHQMEVAKAICDRIAVMEHGKIVEENDVENLFTNPKHPITKAFVRGTENLSAVKFEKNSKSVMVTLNFDANTANSPIVSKVIKTFNVDINILSGKINRLKDNTAGFLTVEILGDKSEIDKAMEMFRNENVIVEVMR